MILPNLSMYELEELATRILQIKLTPNEELAKKSQELIQERLEIGQENQKLLYVETAENTERAAKSKTMYDWLAKHNFTTATEAARMC